MRRTLDILSLDLDWFNHCKDSKCLEEQIVTFFANLRLRCGLPSTVAYMVEHQYFYPWCSQLFERVGATRAHIINVDEHHDFYYMSDIEDFETADVCCGNFFGYMAHAGMIASYTWVTADSSVSEIMVHRSELDRELRTASSVRVRALRKRAKVHGPAQTWKVLDGKVFDGIAIVKSPVYTYNSNCVFSVVERILNRYFSQQRGFTVGRHKCRKDYNNQARYGINMSKLLPQPV